MATTPYLGMTLLANAQAQPDVPINAALETLDKVASGLDNSLSLTVTTDVTLTSIQSTKNLVLLSGTPASDFYIQYPTAAMGVRVIKNGTSKIATIKHASGSTVAVAVGGTVQVYSDGTNILSLSSTGGMIGSVVPWAGSTAPIGWHVCDGSLLNPATYPGLFSIVGTTYGGDGTTTFGIPDLRGRMPIGAGTASGLSTNRTLGTKAGTESVSVSGTADGNITIATTNLPAHNHTATTTQEISNSAAGVITSFTNNRLSTSPSSGGIMAGIFQDFGTSPTSPTTMQGFTTTTDNTGSGTALAVSLPLTATAATMSPFSCVNFIICLEGVFPSF